MVLHNEIVFENDVCEHLALNVFALKRNYILSSDQP